MPSEKRHKTVGRNLSKRGTAVCLARAKPDNGAIGTFVKRQREGTEWMTTAGVAEGDIDGELAKPGRGLNGTPESMLGVRRPSSEWKKNGGKG